MRVLTAVFLVSMAVHAAAVQPDEILKDPALEARARALSAELRCLVCQNQSIDDSDATLARDLRILIREQISQRKSDAEVMAYVTARYGDYVLLRPPLDGRTVALWLSPFVIMLGAGWFILRGSRRGRDVAESELTAADEDRLKRVLAERTDPSA
jgi:cytochrome c-type biogenesis protein CcmH